MAKNNRMLIQSFKVATFRNGMNIYGQKTLVRIVEASQQELKGLKIGECQKYKIDTTLFGDKEIHIPIKDIMANDSENYNYVLNQVMKLDDRIITIDKGKTLIKVPLITKLSYEKGSGMMKLKIDVDIWEQIMDFSKGFRKYELEKVLELKNTNAMRFYQLLSGQKRPISYNFEELKSILGLEGKYPRIDHFVQRVIEPAKAELDEKSPYTFNWTYIEHEGKRIDRPIRTGITFYPIFQPNKADKELMEKEDFGHIRTNYPQVVEIPEEVINYLIGTLGFTYNGIHNNHEMILSACNNIYEFEDFLREIAPKSRKAKTNQQGYVINAIKNELMNYGIKF